MESVTFGPTTIATGGFSITDRPCPIYISVSSKLYRRMTREKNAMLNGRFEVTEDLFYSALMLISWSLHELSDLVHREGNIGSGQT